MKTQISRDGYRRDKRYSGVYQQQGRLITDSDWNELVDTVKARVDDALVDVVGTGSPKGRAATIQMVVTTPKIVPGTVYAGGLEAQVADPPGVIGPFDYSLQADFPSAPPLPALNTAYRFYVDAWDRPVGSLEDNGLRDPALHGADTTTRTQIMAQVKWCPVAKNPENPSDNPGQGDARLTVKYPSGGNQSTADACDPKAQEVDPVGGDFLFRVEVHDVRWPAGAAPNAPNRIVVKWSRENGAEQYAFADMPDWFKTGPWIYELYDVDSEKHLGFHLATTNWTPKRGTLTTTLPATAPAGTMVRRWEGYSVLVRSGSLWSISTASGEKTADTAGGADVQVASAMTVSLADLELTLEFQNKILLPGDFWSTPVRRATYQAGLDLLKFALPAGIVHRYVTLAEVQTNNTLKVRTAQEQRKLAFPRLSELDAGDMGYSTTCSSGLFDSTHDTVKKALDRLCSIGAVHVGYTKPSDNSVYKGNNPATVKDALDLLANVTSDDIGYTTTCTSGLFDNTHNTVEKALNRLCAINATHVGFTKPADTSVFQGSNPTTVAQAVGLLADVKSQQISYTANSNPAIHDVKAALDELYARPVQNGSRVYIGQNGQYATIDLAVSDLIAQNKKDMALALLPGDHALPANWTPGLTDVHLSILGLGGAARLKMPAGTTTFNSLASFRLDQTTVVLENAAITFNQCREVFLNNNVLEGSRISNKAMIYLAGPQDVAIRGNVIDTQWESLDTNIVTVLGLNAFEDIADLFSVGLSEFRLRSRTLSQTLLNLPAATRTPLGNGITSRATSNAGLAVDEREAYQALGNAIATGTPAYVMQSWFERTRQVLYAKNPGTSIVLNAFLGPTVIQNNRISGLIGQLSLPKAATSLNGVNLGGFYSNFQGGGKLSLLQTRYTLQISGNVMAGIRGGESLINALRGIANSGSFESYPGMFKYLDMTDNVIENEDNLFLAEEINLHGNNFTSMQAPIVGVQGLVGWLIGSSATVNDNRARLSLQANSILQSGIVSHSSNTMFNSNFRIIIGSFIIS
jgi:hypothetical protein